MQDRLAEAIQLRETGRAKQDTTILVTKPFSTTNEVFRTMHPIWMKLGNMEV